MSETIQVTPNGTAIKFQTKPWRRYFMKKGPLTPLQIAGAARRVRKSWCSLRLVSFPKDCHSLSR